MPGADSDLVDAAAARIRSLAAHDPFTDGDERRHVVVHGDATAATRSYCALFEHGPAES